MSHVVHGWSSSDAKFSRQLRNETRGGLEKDLKMALECNGTSDWSFYWIYFTNWSWTLLVASFIFDTVLVTLRYIEQKKSINDKFEENGNVIRPTYRGNFF